MYENIREWLLKEYEQAGIQGLRIETVMSVLNDTLAQIEEKGAYDKRFLMSKNLSVLLYKSGTIEVHIGIENVLSTYKEFRNV